MGDLYTEKVQQLLYLSIEKAKELNHFQVDVCHLLDSFLDDSSSMLCNVFNKIGVSISRVKGIVTNYISSIRKENNVDDVRMSYDLSLLINNAESISKKMVFH